MNLFLSLFAVGLVTSIHCIFMCGGLVLTYAVKGTEDGPWYRRLVPHLAYQGSKILSYAVVALALGGVVALLGRAVDITPFRNWLMVVAGVYMVLLGIGMTGKVKVLRYLTPRPPKFLVKALSSERRKASADAAEGHTSLATPISFGLLTGLMPCAPLIAAQASAMATGSPLLGAWAMVGFGLGTMPLMLVFGFASSLLSRQFQARLQVVAAVAVMIFGIVILNRGLMVVGSPVTFDTVRAAVVGTSVAQTPSGTQYKTGADGVVEIPMTIQNATYIPATVSIPADKPVRLIVDRKEANACSAQLALPQLGILKNLADNAVTVVDIPATKAGTYTLTCGMGMISGSLVAGGASGGGSGGGSPWLLALGSVALVGGGFSAHSVRSSRLRREAAAAQAAAEARRSKSGKKGATRDGSPSGRPSVADSHAPALWGFRPLELGIAASLIGLAIVIGLASGGFFH